MIRGVICLLVLFQSSQIFAQISLNVKDYGAIGDGLHDDTESIQHAIDIGAQQNKIVFIPTGTYLITSLDITSSLKGSTNTILLKKASAKLETYSFCKISNQNSIVVENIVFNGAAKLGVDKEPTEGSIPLFIIKSHDIDVQNCKFLNSVMSGLRIESSSNIKISKCESAASRGKFGDGFYFSNSSEMSITNCRANDFTRIGFVAEKNSYSLDFESCLAQNGHSASKIRGGSEYNGGFWYENSGNISTVNCTALNITHRGFVAVSSSALGTILNSRGVQFTFVNCITENVPLGFQASSKTGAPITAKYEKCIARNSTKGFTLKASNQEDLFSYLRCTSILSPIDINSKNVVGFSWESNSFLPAANKNIQRPTMIIKDCFVDYTQSVNLTQLLRKDNNNGDLSTYTGGEINILIDNLKNSLGGGEVILKARKGKPNYKIQNTSVKTGYVK